MLTRCPYTLQPLSDLRVSSDEHIIPYALGGSDQLTLRADRSANSRLGNSVDSTLVHAGLVRLFAAQVGVSSRPKRGKPAASVVFRTQGVELVTGRAVNITFEHDRLGAEYVQPVEVDPLTREIRGIYGIGEQTQRVMADVAKGMGRKGRTFEAGEMQTRPQPQIQGHFDMNLFDVLPGLAKIAYLVTARTLGDRFVDSPAATCYRNAIWSESRSQFDASGLEYYPFQDFAFLPTTTPSQHLVACYRTDDIVVTVVRLFSQPLLSMVCVVPGGDAALDPLEGTVIINDAKARTITERTLLQTLRFT